MLKIGIADGHPLMRDGIRSTFEREADFHVVASGCDSADALQIVAEHKPHVMVLELDLAGGGLNAARKMKLANPRVCVVFLTSSERGEDVKAALSLGAQGYILKGISGSDLIKTIRAVAAGETYITPTLAVTLLSAPFSPSQELDTTLQMNANLSVREEQILQAVAKGFKNREIANQLRLSEKTIKNYMSGILYKLNSRNRVEAVLAARRSKAN